MSNDLHAQQSDDFDSAQQWKLAQWFRKMDQEVDRSIQQEDFDHISAIEFDDTGRFLATGDNSGNIVVLENDGPGKNGAPAHFVFFNEFSSHYRDYNFGKGEAIDPKICDIKFGPSTNDAVFLFATSESEIKLWRIQDQEQYQFVDWNFHPAQPLDDDMFSGRLPPRRQEPFRDKPDPLDLPMMRTKPIVTKLKIPKRLITETAKVSFLRREYANTLHQYSITSLGILADKQNFISADFFRINLWDFYTQGKCYNLVDRAPTDMSELNEIITNIDCHPVEANRFLYTTSTGNINICDLRLNATSEYPAQTLSHRSSERSRRYGASSAGDDALDMDFIDDMLCTVSDARFSKGGSFIVSRDYMSVRIWDAKMPKYPVETVYVHEYLREKVWDLYSGDFVLDSFGLGMSPQGDVVTGTYGNYFHIMDFASKKDTFIQAGNHGHRTSPLGRLRNMKKTDSNKSVDSVKEDRSKSRLGFGGIVNFLGGKSRNRGHSTASSKPPEDEYPYNLPVEKLDFSKKILNSAWHPTTNTVAVAGDNNVFVYGKV